MYLSFASPYRAEVVRVGLRVLLLALAPICFVRAGDDTNTYNDGEVVRVYASQIGPLHDAFETYNFFQVPGCPPAAGGEKSPTLGQILVGRKLLAMNMDVQFGRNVTGGVLCTFKPTKAHIKRLKKMVEREFAYQIFVDELPLWGMLGEVTPAGPTIFVHRDFNLGITRNQIVDATMQTGKAELLAEDREYTFTYSVNFTHSSIPFAERFSKYVDKDTLELRVRWMSIVNSVYLLSVLVVVIACIILQVLRVDSKNAELEVGFEDYSDNVVESSGWKQLSADVHRVPAYPVAFCALLGTGVQLLLVFAVIIFSAAYYGLRHKPTYGAVTMAVQAYALTGFVAGFVSASKFLPYTVLNPSLAGKWVLCTHLTMIGFPAFLIAVGIVTNIVAFIYGSSRAVHFGGFLYVIFLLLLFCPTVLAGALAGRYICRRHLTRTNNHYALPHVNHIPRLVPPPGHFLFSRSSLVILTGFLPFSSIAIELFLVLSTLWLNKMYYVYTLLIVTFAMFVLITAGTSVVATYLLLNMEDHRWPWTAFGFGASVGFYVLLYALYFYLFHTSMSSFFVTVFFCAYSLTLSLSIGLAGGSVSFIVASLFVQKIYSSVKVD
uniref:Transmembrane 9 superfamily member n=1 Tax=Trypanosoma congolense (strain IL3000) TaxID=1068625 RepID=G0UZX1_TRYCI|nr:putative endosomal integral membrane protein [Trypanosoma congolense IL3000]